MIGVILNLFSQTEVYKAGLPDVPGLMGVDEEGNPYGFPIELTRELAEQAGIELEWVEGKWSELFSALKEGELDMLPGTMITQERMEYLDFLDSIYYILSIWKTKILPLPGMIITARVFLII